MQITELRLKTQFLAAVRDFYAGELALPFAGRTRSAIAFQAGATRLVFEQVEDASEPLYHFAFNIPENQLEAARVWLVQRTDILVINGRDTVDWPAWNAHAVYFIDPAGNIVEFIARHNLPNASHDPFSAHNLCEVSEIGLAVEDVAAASQALQRAPGIAVFDVGDGEIFTALGDDHGLFIIVRRGRNWFPTEDRPADLWPVAVTMRGERPGAYSLSGLPYTVRVE